MPKKPKLISSMKTWKTSWNYYQKTNNKKRCPVHHRVLECKSRKSRNTRNNRQVWPWKTKWSRAKANRILPRECTGHSKHPFSTTQETTLYKDITKWSILKSGCSWRWRSCTQSEKRRSGADCGSDYQLLRPKFRLKLKKVGKTTRPVICDVNQILYEHTVEVMNRFRELDLVDRVPEELWPELYRRQLTKSSQRKRNARRQSGCLRSLTNNWGKKRSKKQGRKGKVYRIKCRVPENSMEGQEDLLHWTIQRNKGNNRIGKIKITSRKLDVSKKHFMQRWTQ